MPKKKTDSHWPELPDSSLDDWARELINAVSKDEARQILEDYRRIASDRRVTKEGQRIALERVEILERNL